MRPFSYAKPPLIVHLGQLGLDPVDELFPIERGKDINTFLTFAFGRDPFDQLVDAHVEEVGNGNEVLDPGFENPVFPIEDRLAGYPEKAPELGLAQTLFDPKSLKFHGSFIKRGLRKG